MCDTHFYVLILVKNKSEYINLILYHIKKYLYLLIKVKFPKKYLVCYVHTVLCAYKCINNKVIITNKS